MERWQGPGWKRSAGMLMLAVAAASCTAILGIDKDYRESESGMGGAASASGGTGGVASSASSTSASIGAGGTGGGGTGGADGGPGPTTLRYKATVADCVSLASPNPDACEAQTGAGKMRIDSMDTMTGKPYVAFLRFDLDNALVGRTVVAVTLHLSTTSDATAASDKSGAIWRVSAFDRATLFNAVPSNKGGSPVAGDLGSVGLSKTYSWSLPVTLVAPSASLYLGLEPGSLDGATYWNAKGMTPPELVIDVQ